MEQADIKPDVNGQSEQKPAVSNDSPIENGATPEVLALRSRIKEEADKRRASDLRVSEYESLAEKSRQSDLEKKGEYETLLAEERTRREKAETKADEWTKYETSKRLSLLEKLPEDQRETYSGLSLEALDAHVNNF